MNVTENICPVCKAKNDLEAQVCGQCGAALNDPSMEWGHPTKTTDMEALTPAQIKDWSFQEAVAPDVPATGLAVHIDGDPKPAWVDARAEFILGRKAENTAGMVVDLSPFGAYSLGLSRRHVLIRRTADRYEVMDLGSVNGTWLNEQRLAPHTVYPLPSGSHLRLARMHVVVLYHPFAETK
jgi:hypothetical protein